jgi:hypothetical protein
LLHFLLLLFICFLFLLHLLYLLFGHFLLHDRFCFGSFTLSSSDVVVIESTVGKGATSGFDTHDKKNWHKRAAKDDRTPLKMKKIKISQDVDATCSKLFNMVAN